MDIYEMRNKMNMGKSIYDLPLRVTFYARVSTDSDEQINSLKNQIDFYTDFISRNTAWTYIEGYIDEGISGTSVSKRESFLKMIDDGKQGKFDFIVTKEISRFSRNTLDSIKYTQELLDAGVGVLFQSDNINTLLPDSELRLTIMSSIAQDEVRRLSERVKFGFKRSVEKGVVLGNSRITGYTKQDGKLVIVEEEAEMVRKIFNMYATENKGIRLISAALNEQGYKNENGKEIAFITIKRILINPKYKGYYCGNKSVKYDYRNKAQKKLDASEWIMYKDEENVPPIVSEELWDKANAILENRGKKIKNKAAAGFQSRYAYSGKIFCGEHDVPYHRRLFKYPSGDKELWGCKEYVNRGRAGCDRPTVYTTELDEIMKDAYSVFVASKPNIVSDMIRAYSSTLESSNIKEDIAKITVEIEDIRKRKNKLLDLSVNGHISDEEFSKRNREFNLEIEGLEVKQANLKEDEEKNNDIAAQISSLEKLITEELNFEHGFNNAVIDSLLDKIVVEKSDDKKIINLKVYLKLFSDEAVYRIDRKQGQISKTSFCLPSRA